MGAISNWLAIVAVALLTLTIVGFNDSLKASGIDGRGTLGEMALLPVFASVLLLIVDLDRASEGVGARG